MLYTSEYITQLKEMHANPEFGTCSIRYAKAITNVINKFNVFSLIDYGCGKGDLAKYIIPDNSVQIHLYDPAVPEYDELPEPQDMVVCTDVLEHIEPDCLDDVLASIKNSCTQVAFVSVCTCPASKNLPDGRNAHLIQKSPRWWLDKLSNYFILDMYMRHGDSHFVAVLLPL